MNGIGPNPVVRLSAHAEIRCAQRGIAPADVARIVAAPWSLRVSRSSGALIFTGRAIVSGSRWAWIAVAVAADGVVRTVWEMTP